MDEESLTYINQSVRDTGRVSIGTHYDQFDPGDAIRSAADAVYGPAQKHPVMAHKRTKALAVGAPNGLTIS